MGIETLLMMIPKGGKFATSVVNKVYNLPKNWEKFTSAVRQIERILKEGRLRLDGKQQTIFESNKNILKNHEKVTQKKVEVPPVKKPEDYFKGWTPTLVQRSKARDIYKADPPEHLYTKEMEAIDEELDALAFGGEKYASLSSAEKAAIFKKLQTEMQKLIKIAKDNDLSTLSLSQINKKSQNLQKRIREIADNPDIKGTVNEGPKRDMIKALYDSENVALTNARQMITKKNSELKYGKKYPVLDPENDAFIVIGLDEVGHPIKMGRFTGKFSATKDKTTGELTSGKGTSFYDKWNAETNQMRKKGEEVFHETLNREGKVIMSNPEYKIPKTQNMDIQTEFYTDLSTSDLAKKGFTLKQVDMIRKGRKVREYLERNKSLDVNIRMHEQTSTNDIGPVLEDLYNRSDDVYKMSIEEWVTKIPEYFARGGHVPGFATGGVSNLFRQRQGYRSGEVVTGGIKLVKGARWVIRMLKELADDMIFGGEQFAKIAEPEKIRLYKETQAAIKHLESGGPIPENLIQSLRQDARFKNLTVSKGGDKDFVEIQEVVLGKPIKGTGEKIIEGKVVEQEYLEKGIAEGAAEQIENINLMKFKNTLPKDLLDKVNQLPVEKQTNLLIVMKRAFDAAKKGNVDKGVDVLQEQLLTDFIPKGKPHATGGLIDGYATGGVSNLFRQRYRSGKAVELATKIPEFLKFVEELFITASNTIRKAGNMAKHNDLTKILEQWQKTKKLPDGMEKYFGVDPYIAFGKSRGIKIVKNPKTEATEGITYTKTEITPTSKTTSTSSGDMLFRTSPEVRTHKGPHSDIEEATSRTGKVFDSKTDRYVTPVKKTVPKVSGDTYLEALDKRIMKEMEITKSEMNNMSSTALDDLRRNADPKGMQKHFDEITEGRGVGDFADDPNFLKDVAPVKTKKTRTMDDLVEQAYEEIRGGSGFAGDLKYDADILASEIATVGGKIYDDLAAVEKAGIYDLAYKRMVKNLKLKMDFKKDLKDIEQKIELQMFDTKGKKGNAAGGLIDGYATGGVSNLFRSR